MEIVTKIKEHPYLSATVVFVIGVALIMYMRSGQSAPPAQAAAFDPSSSVAAGTALQQSQLAANADATHTAAALQATMDTNATNVAIAQLAAGVQVNGQNVQADTINKQTSAQENVAIQTTALQAHVQEAQFEAQTAQEGMVAAAYSQGAQIAASLQQFIVGKQAEVTEDQINSNRDITLAQNNLALQTASYQYLTNTNAITTAGAVAIHQSDLAYATSIHQADTALLTSIHQEDTASAVAIHQSDATIAVTQAALQAQKDTNWLNAIIAINR